MWLRVPQVGLQVWLDPGVQSDPSGTNVSFQLWVLCPLHHSLMVLLVGDGKLAKASSRPHDSPRSRESSQHSLTSQGTILPACAWSHDHC